MLIFILNHNESVEEDNRMSPRLLHRVREMRHVKSGESSKRNALFKWNLIGGEYIQTQSLKGPAQLQFQALNGKP